MVKSNPSEDKLEAIKKQIKDKATSYRYRTKDYPFEVIYTKFGDEDDPDTTLYIPSYQRKFVWKERRQSKFIESVLLGVPLTPFLVSEKKGKLEIIDGSQRIRTLIEFYDNKLKLKDLEKLTEINSARFKDLPEYFQNEIKNRDFRVIVVENADIDIRRDIFERINTTSEKLTDAEVRKGSYAGKFYDLILELKESKDFIGICPVTELKEKRGEYEELILRFFAFVDKYKEFKHEVVGFLNSYLKEMNETDFDKEQYREIFYDMVSFIKKYLPFGFRKEEKSQSTPRVRFEAIAVGTYLAIKENPGLKKPDLKWLDSKEFKKHTTSDSSNNPGRLKARIEFVRDGLLGKFDNGSSQD